MGLIDTTELGSLDMDAVVDKNIFVLEYNTLETGIALFFAVVLPRRVVIARLVANELRGS